jgi:2-iminobutanoate/2-iminopropanoate deaminase
MTKRVITTTHAPSSPLFSQGVRVGSTIYVSGMVGIDPATMELAGATIQEQTLQALRNCEAVIEAGGGTLSDVAQVTVLLTSPGDFDGMNETYATVFTTEPPARPRGSQTRSRSSQRPRVNHDDRARRGLTTMRTETCASSSRHLANGRGGR